MIQKCNYPINGRSITHSDTINCTEQSAAAKYLPLPPLLRTNRRRVIRPTDCLSRKIHCATQKCPTGWYIKVIFFQGPLMPLLQLHSFLELRWTRCIQLHVNCQCKELPTFDWTSKSNSVEGRLMVLRIYLSFHTIGLLNKSLCWLFISCYSNQCLHPIGIDILYICKSIHHLLPFLKKLESARPFTAGPPDGWWPSPNKVGRLVWKYLIMTPENSDLIFIWLYYGM